MNHKWKEEDKYGISECLKCKCLMKKKANTFQELDKGFRANGKWIVYYSKRSSKWTMVAPECN